MDEGMLIDHLNAPPAAKKKGIMKPRPPSAPSIRQPIKTRVRPKTAQYWKRKNNEQNIYPQSGGMNNNNNTRRNYDASNYNFFNLNILGQTQRKVFKGSSNSRRKFKGKTRRKRIQSAKEPRPVTRMQMNRLHTNTNTGKHNESRRPQTAKEIRRKHKNATTTTTTKNNIHVTRYEPYLNMNGINRKRNIIKPTKGLMDDLKSAGLTEKMIEEDRHEREKPSLTQLKILLKRWMNDDDINERAFNSFAVFCEYKLRKGLATTERYIGTNPLRVAITGMCIDRASKEMLNYEGFLSAFADEYFKAIYVNWEDLKLELDRDGNTADGTKLFNAKTYFSEYERIDIENRIYTLRINDFIRIQNDIMKEMNDRKMITSLGIVKRHFNTLMQISKNTFRRSKQTDITVQNAKATVDENINKGNIMNRFDNENNFNNVNNIDILAEVIDKLDSSSLGELVLDLGMNHSDYVSIEKVLSPLFNVMPAEERYKFILEMSKSMSENEQQVWLETVSTGKRDNGFRFVLRKVLNNEEFDKVIPLLRGEDKKQKEIDFALLKAISLLKMKDNHSNTELHAKFIKIISAMVYEDMENQKLDDDNDDDDSEENEIANIVASGMTSTKQNNNKNSEENNNYSIEKVHNVLELKFQEIIRRRRVAEDERDLLKDQLFKLKQNMKSLENEMGEKAQLKSHMRQIEEYGTPQVSSSIRAAAAATTTTTTVTTGNKVNDENTTAPSENKTTHVEEINQPNLRKQGRARRLSFVGMLQDDAKETILLRHDDNNSANANVNNFNTQNKRQSLGENLPLISKPKETLSLVECNLIITNIYQDKLISDSHCDKSCRQRSTLGEYTKYFFVKQHGSRSLAIQNSSMLHNALIKHSNDNFRCRVFALLIGSVDPHSYLNRVEATDFFLRTVMAIFDINEKDLFFNNKLPVSVKEMMGDGLNYDSLKHRPCLIEQEKAAKVVREMFTNNNVSIMYPLPSNLTT